jgi:hypothetical protein
VQKSLQSRVWRQAKFLIRIIIASVVGILLAGYPNSSRDSFLGDLGGGQSASHSGKLFLHKRWRPYNPFRKEKLHIQGGQRPERSE